MVMNLFVVNLSIIQWIETHSNKNEWWSPQKWTLNASWTMATTAMYYNRAGAHLTNLHQYQLNCIEWSVPYTIRAGKYLQIKEKCQSQLKMKKTLRCDCNEYQYFIEEKSFFCQLILKIKTTYVQRIIIEIIKISKNETKSEIVDCSMEIFILYGKWCFNGTQKALTTQIHTTKIFWIEEKFENMKKNQNIDTIIIQTHIK